jgi:subtilisin-like proprotein convertase family protein
MNWKSCGLAASAVLSIVGAAQAQPATFTDLGTLSNGVITPTATMGGTAATNVVWFKFVVPTGVTASAGWLDLTMDGSPGFSNSDSMMGLYSNTGVLITSDDDDSVGFYSEISKGRTSPLRTTVSGATGGNGRDGTLAAGTYWMSISPYSTTFNSTGWNVVNTTNTTTTGSSGVRISYDNGLAPTPPTGVGSATVNPVASGASTLLKVTVTPGQNPLTTAHQVTVNLSAIGGSATQQFYDDGTNGDVTPGDNVYSFAYTIPVGLCPGGQNCPYTVQETAPGNTRSSNGILALVTTGSPAACATDLGTLSLPCTTVDSPTVNLPTATVAWFKINVPVVTNAAGDYLDMVTSATISGGSFTNDTYMAVFDNTGTMVSFNDDGGPLSLSAMSFGLTSPTRAANSVYPAGGAADVAYAGANGGLTAGGTYWIAVSGYPMTTGSNWNATSSSNHTSGSVAVHMNLCSLTTPTVTGQTSSAAAGDPVVVKAAITPVAGHAITSVTANLTSIGGPAAQQMYDDGTHGDVTAGDNTYSVSYTIPGATAIAAYSVPVTATDNQPATGSGAATVNVTAPTAMAVALALSPNSGFTGVTFTATATLTPATGPLSTGTAVSLDATAINGGTVTLYDDGTHGDLVAGNNVFTNNAVTVGAVPDGDYTLTANASDAQLRTATGTATFHHGLCPVSTGLDCSSTSFEYIGNTAVGSLNHASVCTDAVAGYQDLTAFAGAILPGQSQPITVSITRYFASDHCRVYVDWNNNGVLNDAGEETVLVDTSANMTGTITCPPGTTLGPKRMRVYLTYSTTPSACLTGQLYGHILDYTMNVVNSAPPGIAGNPASGAVGGTVLLTANVTSGVFPNSLSYTVTGDLTSIGGAAGTTFYDDGTHGDAVAGDNVYSLSYSVPHAPTQSAGNFSVPVHVVDDQLRTGDGSIAVALTAEPTGRCCNQTDYSCAVTTQYMCEVNPGGGVYGGNGSNCSGSPNVFTHDLNLAIPDAGAPVSDTINVASSFAIAGVSVRATVPDHTWIGDLTIEITHGANTVLMWNRQCGGDNGVDVTFADGAPAVVCAEPTVGTYASSSPLSVFNGFDSAGDWTITVQDWAGGDVGTLTHWELNVLSPFSCAPPTGSCCTSGPLPNNTGGHQCNVTTQAACTAVGGTWTAGGTCSSSNSCGPFCGSANFNCDGDSGTDADIEAFFSCLSGNCPPLPCLESANFNGDGDTGTDSDIEAFFRVLGGGNC